MELDETLCKQTPEKVPHLLKWLAVETRVGKFDTEDQAECGVDYIQCSPPLLRVRSRGVGSQTRNKGIPNEDNRLRELIGLGDHLKRLFDEHNLDHVKGLTASGGESQAIGSSGFCRRGC